MKNTLQHESDICATGNFNHKHHTKYNYYEQTSAKGIP